MGRVGLISPAWAALFNVGEGAFISSLQYISFGQLCQATTLLRCYVHCEQCRLLLAEDGSGRGAAFVAAVATKHQRR